MTAVLFMVIAAAEQTEENPFVPYLPFLGILAGILGTGVFGVIRDKLGNSASKTPTIGEIWKRMDGFERELRAERGARITLRSVFLQYVGRVQSGGSAALTHDEHAALFEGEQREAEPSA